MCYIRCYNACSWQTRLILLLIFTFLSLLAARAQASERPNILWITVEDMSPHLGSYGDPFVHTPNLDRLAKKSIRYTHAIATAPVCAPARSTLITGMYQTSIGTHHMRNQARLPNDIRCFTEYLREAGYYCTNNAKEDYQFTTPPTAWDESSHQAHWRNRKEKDQPFFSVFNLHTTHESRIANDSIYARVVENLADSIQQKPEQLPLPPYYPDTELVRRDWARYYNVIAVMDQEVQAILDQLAADGLAENTIVFFFSDHGVGLPRGKRWLYDSGLRVPLLVYLPEKYRKVSSFRGGEVNDALISFVDMAPTVLHLAGVAVPGYMQGSAFLGDDLKPQRKYAYAARDRMDERYDMIRAVRSKRYKYIRYYEPYKPFFQYMNTPEKGVIMKEWRRLDEEGALPPLAAYYMASQKPQEELFDVQADPHELFNLAHEEKYQDILQEMRQAHIQWAEDTKDIGLIPEPLIERLQQTQESAIYSIARGDAPLPIARISETARRWTEGASAVSVLGNDLSDADAAVRYWAAIGLGNLAAQARSQAGLLERNLQDSAMIVRIAAARALCKMERCEVAIKVLQQALRSDQEWERLHAAIVLDEMGEQARPAIPALQQVMNDKNKYVVRVANRALNQLLGATHVVP